MSSRRVMNGATDLTGSTNPQGQRITRMVSRRPLAWELTCTICGTSQSPIAHSRAEYASCRNGMCGKSVTTPRATLASTSRAGVAQRDRTNREIREFHEQEEEQERQRAQADEERRIAEQGQREEQRRTAHRAFIAECVLNSPDATFFTLDPATLTPLPKGVTVAAYNREQAALFVQQTPEYLAYKSDQTLRAIADYLDRNAPGIKLVSALQLRWAFERLKSLGLIQLNPAPIPEPESGAAPAQVNLGVGPPSDPNSPDAVVEGWDLESGAPRKWTNRELNKLSSTDYRRALRLYSVEAARHLGLPGSERVLIAAGKMV